ncbi:hypothetical protein PM082_009474 [Marasmius tenuissimus]|nr:hypothetical protein PM082_009474 [Marasmius tenuissimus]
MFVLDMPWPTFSLLVGTNLSRLRHLRILNGKEPDCLKTSSQVYPLVSLRFSNFRKNTMTQIYARMFPSDSLPAMHSNAT